MAVRHYKFVFTTAGPVHIGNGEKYGSKDYFKIDKKRVAVLDAKKFVGGLGPDDLDAYCRFLESNSRTSLQEFLEKHPSLIVRARKCAAYTTAMTLARARGGTEQYYDVVKFVKDAYGNPYVPGSSVKGMMRTALLAQLIQNNPSAYLSLYDSSAAQGRSRKTACRSIERKAFWLEKPDAVDSKTTNDIMRYVSVSDSPPLSTSNLVFVKKYDKFSRDDSGHHKLSMGRISEDSGYYEGNELNIYRECLRPGTKIEVSVDVDDRIDAYLGGLVLDRDGIASLLDSAFELYERCFLDHFDLGGVAGLSAEGGPQDADDGICRYVIPSGPMAGRRCRNRSVDGTGYCNTHRDSATRNSKQLGCYIGGGVDFESKTIISALFGEDRSRVSEISRILYTQFPTKIDSVIYPGLKDEVREAGFEPRAMHAKYNRRGGLIRGKDDHRHWMDEKLGVSPHTLKLGIIGGKKYLMGRCILEIEEAE